MLGNNFCSQHNKTLSFFCFESKWHFELLCDLCISDHIEEHNKNKTKPKIENIETSMNELTNKLNNQGQKIQEIEENLRNLKHEGSDDELLKKTNHYFDYLKNEILKNLDFLKEKYFEKLKNIIKPIHNKIDDILNLKLRNEMIQINEIKKSFSINQFKVYYNTAKKYAVSFDLEEKSTKLSQSIFNLIPKITNDEYQKDLINQLIGHLNIELDKKFIEATEEISKSQELDSIAVIKEEKKEMKKKPKLPLCPNCKIKTEYISSFKKSVKCMKCGFSRKV